MKGGDTYNENLGIEEENNFEIAKHAINKYIVYGIENHMKTIKITKEECLKLSQQSPFSFDCIKNWFGEK